MTRRAEDRHEEEALRALGQETAAGLEATTEAQLAAQHRRLLNSLAERAPRRRVSWQVGLAAALAGGAAIAVMVALFLPTAKEIECRDPAGLSLREGATLDSNERPDRAFHFSEGSQIVLGQASRATLKRLGAKEIQISLARGRISSRIRHAAHRRWRFVAGPYRTIVVGTQFSIAWKPEAAQLEVRVNKGLVRVGGGPIQAQGLTVGEGQQLVATDNEVKVLQRGEAFEPPRQPVVSQRDAAPSDAVPGRVKTYKSPPRLDMRWKRLARSGRHAEALEAGRKAGWRRLLKNLGAADLLLLADSARFARDFGAARTVLLTARSRFRRQHGGRIAAYRLGRLSADQIRNYREAATWFRRFRRESPRSALAGDALAGEMLARKRLGEMAEAKRLAAEYLARHPGGAFAATARQLSR